MDKSTVRTDQSETEDFTLVKITGSNEGGLIGTTSEHSEVHIPLSTLPHGRSYVGWKSMLCKKIGEEGSVPLYSGQAYIEQFERVLEDFNTHKRNVYIGRLRATLEKIAFFQIEGTLLCLGVSIRDICVARLNNLQEVQLPKELPIAITQVDEQNGFISGTSKVGFAGFLENIERLNLQVGAELEGYVYNMLPDGSGACLLTPNLTTLIDHCPANRWIRLRITSIDLERMRVKAKEVCELPQKKALNFSSSAFSMDLLPEWIDVEAFNAGLHPLPRTKDREEPTDEEEAPPFTIRWDHFENQDERSPFAIREDETIEHVLIRPVSPSILQYQLAVGGLTDIHRCFARAAAQLKVATSWQMAVLVALEHPELKFSQRQPNRIIKKLVDMSVLQRVILRTNGDGVMYTYCPGVNYRLFMNERPHMPHYLEMTQDSAFIKERLALTQLYFGLRKHWPDASFDSSLMIEENDGRHFFVPFTAKKQGQAYWLGAFRSTQYWRLCDNLLHRWRNVILSQKELPVLVLAIESEADVKEYAPKIAALHLEYEVWLTCDRNALPELDFTKIPASTPNAFERMLRWVGFR